MVLSVNNGRLGLSFNTSRSSPSFLVLQDKRKQMKAKVLSDRGPQGFPGGSHPPPPNRCPPLSHLSFCSFSLLLVFLAGTFSLPKVSMTPWNYRG